MKKFKRILLCSVACLMFGMDANSQQRFPIIQNVGIIPIQWEGDELAPGAAKKMADALNDVYYATVKKSRRFRILNDELVKGSWATQEGRTDLVENYEMQAFVTINAAVRGETVRLVARLLSPQLKNYVSESDAHSLNKLANDSKEDLEDLMSNLVFRLFNRLPVDVTVTSVQGRYVSLSGGSGQNLHVGDEVTIKRPQISALHPADGSWLTFKSQEQGKVKIMDVKQQTAVALISAQSYDGAIAVGDGLKVTDIPGRKHFIQTSGKQVFVDSNNDPDDIVVYTPNNGVAMLPKPEQGKPTPTPAKPASKKEPEPLVAEEKPASPAPVLDNEEQQASPDTEQQTGPALTPSKLNHDGVNFYLGIENWSLSGAAKASSEMSMMLFNYFGAGMRAPFSGPWEIEALGALRFGNTKNGTYSGITGVGRFVYPLKLDLGINAQARFGGEGMLETYAVNGEKFGGGDYLLLGGFGGLEGTTVLIDRHVQWVTDFVVRPFAIGQLGYKGTKKSMGSFFGYSLRGELLFLERSQLSWGAGVDLNGFDAQAGSKVSYSEVMISGIARYKF